MPIEIKITGIEETLKMLGAYKDARLMERALFHTARTVVEPEVKRNVPDGGGAHPSPWRRGYRTKRGAWTKKPVPLGTQIKTVRLTKLRPGEFARVRVGVYKWYNRFVVRGTRPHEIPDAFGKKGLTIVHPGARPNPYLDRLVTGHLLSRIGTEFWRYMKVHARRRR